ncbi:oxidoreductase [Pseudomonas sp. 10B238]|uniref:oxidoreductase n=1 Tax=Pseudomonadaceae TaxID=135621 RepID=UPI0006180D74|nr:MULTISPECIES: oxidoreductase [Pseudomonadaceae]MAL37176.1 NAD(P)-dependent oxidoreductase [Pseudomonas sp.]MBU0950901.1 SDR family NAD(P)-dependent oxidoreductase [Gammaproteobacteria bacterium]KJJ62209.1 oxidoreductase [Pseudomonas sp. 10B238]MBK3794373.1 SDR family NAD(P)-dependent oxidoreductase [Stutzerimonas stutzeri]MBK3875863.1 SDR family NAD(P)-dependent oxidoreductase [Stutzerimonas stutzeri]
MATRPSVMIAGCGDVGIRLGLQLSRAGWTVYGLRRQAASLPVPILPVRGDLASSEVPRGWPNGKLDYLVYAASASQHDEPGYRQAYVEGLRNALGWLEQRGQRPQRVFFVSSTGVYAQNGGEWIDETSATEPTGYTGQVMLEAEQLALECGFPATRVRMAGLYDPVRPWMQNQVRSGLRVERDPPQYSNRIHRDDAAALLACLLQTDLNGGALEDCYLGVDDDPAPLHEVVDWLRERLGVTQWAEQAMTRRAGSKRCSNARARALGWVPQYPSYRNGYASIRPGKG